MCSINSPRNIQKYVKEIQQLPKIAKQNKRMLAQQGRQNPGLCADAGGPSGVLGGRHGFQAAHGVAGFDRSHTMHEHSDKALVSNLENIGFEV